MSEPGYHSSCKAFTVSVSRATYARMLSAARERGITLHRLVRIACADALATERNHCPVQDSADGVLDVSSTQLTDLDDPAVLDGGASADRTHDGGFAEL